MPQTSKDSRDLAIELHYQNTYKLFLHTKLTQLQQISRSTVVGTFQPDAIEK
jgi:hypothetical protein